ncbi:MAG: hypothetical protein D4S01_09085 [Dehalococcoidia bacterium]|nr:MAG: hypothetical protein D4S01_09085 [Dehalococcoidia bacterium]
MNALNIQIPKYKDRASKVIDDVLRKIFGDEATLIIYEYVKKIYSIRQDEIVEKIDDFVDAIRELLGSGAYPVEQKILETLYSSHGIFHKPEFESVESKLSFVSQMSIFFNS